MRGKHRHAPGSAVTSMFYCEDCQQRESWPQSRVRSYGPCDVCDQLDACYDGPVMLLPAQAYPLYRRWLAAVVITVLLLGSLLGMLLEHAPPGYGTCLRLHYAHCQPPPVIG